MTVFISSTVRDFGPVRRDLRAWFERLGITVRTSESGDFPVARGVDSHDACLAAIAGSNFYVLLIGERYGGRWKSTPKSITWREYDEAFAHRIPMVILVLRSANEKAQELAKARAAANPARLAKLQEELPKDFDGVARFIDEVRKGHRDNWCYMDWDGSLTGAVEIVQPAIFNLFVDFQAPYRKLVEDAEHAAARAAALRDMQLAAYELTMSVKRGEQPATSAMGRLLALAASARRELWSFHDEDVWNLMVYRREGELLIPWVRHCDRRIERRERRWRVGQGHVGLAVERAATLVAGDLPLAEGWVAGHDKDAQNYRSAVSVPLYGTPGRGALRRGKPSGAPAGAFVITSSRLDHFLQPDSPEALTAEQVCTMLRMIASAASSTSAA
jgi:hypothetical protein